MLLVLKMTSCSPIRGFYGDILRYRSTGSSVLRRLTPLLLDVGCVVS